MPLMRRKRLVGVVRVDNERARQHGYSVRFAHRGVKRSKWFMDLTYGSATAAERAATLWLRAQRAKVGAPVRWREKK